MTLHVNCQSGSQPSIQQKTSDTISKSALPLKPPQPQSHSLIKKFSREYLLLSLIPVISFFVCTVMGALFAEHHVDELIRNSNKEMTGYAEKQLEDIGQVIIHNKAEDVAAQVKLFLDINSDLDMQQLQKNERFRSIAVQHVGLTGYTCLYEAETGIMRMHPNPDLINQDMQFLSEKLPTWWAIFEPSLEGVEISGYYDWVEADGRIRKKYMTMTPVAVRSQNKTLMVAATTYIDEFSIPVRTMNKKSEEANTKYKDFIANQVVIIGSVMTTILILTLIAVYLLSKHAARRYIYPIVHLAEVVEGFGGGDLDIEATAINQREDELGALARSFSRMRLQIKAQFQKLESNFAKLKSKPNYFDLVISDQTMPGITGDALAKELMKINPGIPVILCTGYSQLINQKMAVENGIKALVMKPILINEMADAISNALKPEGPK